MESFLACYLSAFTLSKKNLSFNFAGSLDSGFKISNAQENHDPYQFLKIMFYTLGALDYMFTAGFFFQYQIANILIQKLYSSRKLQIDSESILR